MTWQQLWAYFKRQNATIQRDILAQLELRPLLSSLDYKAQIGILAGAPQEIFEKYSDVLHEYVLAVHRMRKG